MLTCICRNIKINPDIHNRIPGFYHLDKNKDSLSYPHEILSGPLTCYSKKNKQRQLNPLFCIIRKSNLYSSEKYKQTILIKLMLNGEGSYSAVMIQSIIRNQNTKIFHFIILCLESYSITMIRLSHWKNLLT